MTVNITIVSVSDLAGWDFKLYWLREKLNGTGIVEGSFLRQAGQTQFSLLNFTDNYNATHGLAWVSTVLLGPGPGASGNGTLASISFQAKNAGSTWLWLRETLLVDSAANLIPHTDANGVVYILFHDVAITAVSHSKTIVCQGYSANVSVTAQNQGNYTESFNVTVYANSTTIGSQGVTLASGNSIIVTLIWNTTSFAKANYVISGSSSIMPGETNTTNNSMTDGMVLVTLIGDVNGDRKVRVDDILAVASRFGTNYGGPPNSNGYSYDANCDINDDLKIRADDVLAAALHFGQGPW